MAKSRKKAEEEPPSDAPYEVLYRKHRPGRFSDVVGQGRATEALRQKVIEGHVPHALLFAGPRGTGKTTTARILAMALNCESLEDGEPCGDCDFCRGVLQGSASIGVTEVDAASNRSIDSIRDLIRSMQVGSLSRHRVFIIDEVHQLTKDAATALLKTLEEPPDGVVIILATTDPERIQDAIRSRTAIFRFMSVEQDNIAGLIRSVAEHEGIALTEEQVSGIALEGRGSPRDTLSVLERVGSGDVSDSLGHIVGIMDALLDRDVSAVILTVAKSVRDGVDTVTLTTNLLSHVRDCMIFVHSPDMVNLTPTMQEHVERHSEMKSRRLVALLEALAETLGLMKRAGESRVSLEAMLIKFAVGADSDSPSSNSLDKDELLDEVQDIVESSADDTVKGLEATIGELQDQISRLIDALHAISTSSNGKGDPWAPGSYSNVDDAWPDTSGKSSNDSPEPSVSDEDDDSMESEEGESEQEQGGEGEGSSVADKILDDLFDRSSARLRRRLMDATVTLAEETFMVSLSRDLSESLAEELEELVEDEGYQLEYDTGQ